ncbi:MAG: hypothetical protein CR967_00125 [Proteobacteria bacterium]|nr:MAG: hypothetical protein CR967_00125 [Pseudomonadota bacterium]
MAKKAEKLSLKLNKNIHNIPIMYFMCFIAEDDNIKISSILEAIRQYPALSGYGWEFSEIVPFIKTLDKKRQIASKHFIDFFTNKISFEELEYRLRGF